MSNAYIQLFYIRIQPGKRKFLLGYGQSLRPNCHASSYYFWPLMDSMREPHGISHYKHAPDSTFLVYRTI